MATSAGVSAGAASGTGAGPEVRPAGVLARTARAMERLGSWQVWVPSAIVYAAFATVFFASSAPFAVAQVGAACGRPAPDVNAYTSAAGVHAFLEACGPAGREAYRAMQLADLLYPAVFALFMASSIALALTWSAPRRRLLPALAALPLLGSAFDYLENLCAWLALAAYPEPAATDALLGLASAAKTVTSWAGGLVLIVVLALLGLSAARGSFSAARARRRERVIAAGRPA
ncbi:hypothetical protein OEB99_01120 [Actinotalea sp. M2MS4P-6]|uniref:hypothetical protein n=1 Tax=Actinotalea sp. M2MS4P-6 TaxID=2983762 RepID=UPI0021E382FF|nr:hypothetical protein [Actinotalea sp. M2MS4P-6]MCV2392898.1 hypothetical protein [Actinotalea sp. M2MS4P-6]